jgi:hypothetical protein
VEVEPSSKKKFARLKLDKFFIEFKNLFNTSFNKCPKSTLLNFLKQNRAVLGTSTQLDSLWSIFPNNHIVKMSIALTFNWTIKKIHILNFNL